MVVPGYLLATNHIGMPSPFRRFYSAPQIEFGYSQSSTQVVNRATSPAGESIGLPDEDTGQNRLILSDIEQDNGDNTGPGTRGRGNVELVDIIQNPFTGEREVEMVKKHSTNINIGDIITEDALDKALAKLKDSLTTYGRLSQVDLTQEQGLYILQNLANAKVFSEKVRENVARIWNNPTHSEDKERNLYNLNNAVTQHITHEVADERFEYANRVTVNVLKRFDLAANNKTRLNKLWTPAKGDVVVTTA